jgi:DNA-binding transcriptional LysR family regulator
MHDLGPNDLALVLAIERSGTLTGAGRALGVDQSTVSRRLTELEARLGHALFVRTREGAVPTELGRAWHGAALEVERAVASARQAVAARTEGVSGEVRLATPTVLADHFLLPALPRLLDRHPGLRPQVLSTPDVADLSRLEADVAVRFVRPDAGDLVARRLRTLRYGAFAHRDLALRGEPRGWPWIGWTDPRMSLGMHEWYASQGITPRLAVLAPTSLLAAVRAGLGAALLPRPVAWLDEALEELPVAVPDRSLPLWAVAHRAVRELPRVQVVWDWLAETLGE